MKKTFLLSVMALIVFSFSSLAQIDKVPSQDNDKNATIGNLSIIDQDTTSKKIQIKQYSYTEVGMIYLFVGLFVLYGVWLIIS